MRVLRWIIVPLLAVHVILATYSGYRAIVQVYSVDMVPGCAGLRQRSATCM